jgi:ribonuclease HI
VATHMTTEQDSRRRPLEQSELVCAAMPWIRRKLRDNLVYVRISDNGTPVLGKDGRAEVKYKLHVDAKVYRASARNLEKTGDPDDDKPIALPGEGEGQGQGSPAATGSSKFSVALGDNAVDAVIVYTDGACTGNPGPAGIGVVIKDGDNRRELSEYLGHGTNNIAELTAIERALEHVLEQRERLVIVHSDSSYALGLLTRGWKAKANTELVTRLRSLAKNFPKLRFVKVKGHAGIPENERCDELARRAVERRG